MSNAHSAPAGPPEEAGRGTGVWEFLEDDSIALGVDNVQDYLLRKAHIEADLVLGRLRRRMFGVASAEPRRVGIGVVLLLWLDESVLTAIKNIVNLSFNSNSFVTSQELLRFIEVELWLSFYATSPSLFYSSNNNDEYPPAQTAMPQARYMAILNALSKAQHAGNTDGQRVAPLTFDRDLVHVEDLVRRLCAEMGFVESETIASLDDDMIRLRSKAVDDIGLAHVRNPKKGYGPVQHGIVSITTGLFIDGHVATRGESTVDIIKLLQRSLCGVSIESQIRLPVNFHCLDRGYQSEVVNEHIHSFGGKLVGTFKRTTKFPFTYGKTATPLQREVEEKGEKSAYWAALKRSGGKRTNSSAEQAYALGYRDGLGSVTLCFTTEREFGPGKWSFVCAKKDKSDDAPAETNFSAFENGVIILTKAQRTPDWFLLRKFRATGSVVSRIFNYIAKDAPDTANPRDPVTDPDVEAIIMLLSLRTNQRHVAPPADIITIDLESKSLEELKVLCRERSLPISGTETVLKNHLRDIDTTRNSTKSTSLLGEILSAWFMKPVTSSAMKMGTHNDPNIASHIKSFLQNSGFQVNETKSYGFLCLRDMPFAAFSPDDIALMTSTI